MTHLSDDDLVLHYYRDPGCREGVEVHLQACASCAARSADLSSALDLLPEDGIPPRGDLYGLEVWQRIRPRLSGPEVAFTRHVPVLAAAASVVLAAAAAFMVWGRWAPPAEPPAVSPPVAASPVQADGSRRVLLISIADHLERSDRVLTEIMNADRVDISTQREWAEDLLWAGRLYRQSALEWDEQSVAAVLDDVERTLLDIVHSPAQAPGAGLEDVRGRVESAALLFKIRVLRDELHHQQLGDARPIAPETALSQTS